MIMMLAGQSSITLLELHFVNVTVKHWNYTITSKNDKSTDFIFFKVLESVENNFPLLLPLIFLAIIYIILWLFLCRTLCNWMLKKNAGIIY